MQQVIANIENVLEILKFQHNARMYTVEQEIEHSRLMKRYFLSLKRMTPRTCHMGALPDELIGHVCESLSGMDLLNFMSACTRFYRNPYCIGQIISRGYSEAYLVKRMGFGQTLFTMSIGPARKVIYTDGKEKRPIQIPVTELPKLLGSGYYMYDTELFFYYDKVKQRLVTPIFFSKRDLNVHIHNGNNIRLDFKYVHGRINWKDAKTINSHMMFSKSLMLRSENLKTDHPQIR